MRVVVVVVVALAIAACGRIGFEGDLGGDAAGDGMTGPATLVGTATCQGTPATLEVRDGADAGDSILVVFFMREPMPNTLPTISGGAATWRTDVAFATVDSTNRRQISVFHANLTTPIVAGTLLAIDHPSGSSNGAVLLRFPRPITLTEPAAVSEGDGPAFVGALATAGEQVFCVLVNHNSTAATFEPSMSTLLELTSNCGGTRETAQIHIASGPGNRTAECRGMIGNNFGWAVAMLGYDNLPM